MVGFFFQGQSEFYLPNVLKYTPEHVLSGPFFFMTLGDYPPPLKEERNVVVFRYRLCIFPNEFIPAHR